MINDWLCCEKNDWFGSVGVPSCIEMSIPPSKGVMKDDCGEGLILFRGGSCDSEFGKSAKLAPWLMIAPLSKLPCEAMLCKLCWLP